MMIKDLEKHLKALSNLKVIVDNNIDNKKTYIDNK